MTGSREQQFHVYLYERIIGRFHRRDNLTRFVFEPDYWHDPECPVLGLCFEEDREARHRANLRLPPWFSNLLPEGRLQEWIARAGRISIDREMDLLAQVGHDLPGAVRVLPAQDLAPSICPKEKRPCPYRKTDGPPSGVSRSPVWGSSSTCWPEAIGWSFRPSVTGGTGSSSSLTPIFRILPITNGR